MDRIDSQSRRQQNDKPERRTQVPRILSRRVQLSPSRRTMPRPRRPSTISSSASRRRNRKRRRRRSKSISSRSSIPVKAGWKKVFDEEFDGDRVDPGKWYFSPTSEKDYAKVHDGLLEIVCNWATPDKTKTKSASLYSNEVFGHGYFEARVKFRQQSGWWSAFWLCTHGPSNPFLDGWEIDIYEDYYMGPKNPGEEPRGVLDHNLHVFACGTLRSWNYGSKLPGKVDDWYVVSLQMDALRSLVLPQRQAHPVGSEPQPVQLGDVRPVQPRGRLRSAARHSFRLLRQVRRRPDEGKISREFLRRLRPDLRISARLRPGCQAGQEA